MLFASFHWGHLPANTYEIYVNNIIAPKEASIWQSGIEKNDKIISINNTNITNLNSILSIIKNSNSYDGYYNKYQANEKLAKLKEMNLAFQTDEVIPNGVTVKLPEVTDEAAISYSKDAEKGFVAYKNDDEKLEDKLISLRDDLIANNYSYFTGNEQYTLEDISKAMSDTRHPIYIKVQRDDKIIDLNPVYTDKDGNEIAKNFRWLQNFGFNITGVVQSGAPYTKYHSNLQQTIVGSYRGARLPWSFRVDLSVDKAYNLKVGKRMTVLSFFARITNVFNIKNIRSVYGVTGDPDDNGYLTDPETQTIVAGQLNEQSYRDYYTMYLDMANYNYSTPRMVYLGVSYQF